MVRASPVNQVLIAIKSVAVRTIPAGINGLINVSSLLRPAKKLLRCSKMSLFCSANPGIVGHFQFRPCQAKGLIHLLDPCDDIDIVRFGSFHHMLAVLVKPHAEKRVMSLKAMIASNHISRYLLQRMPDMWRGIRIINGSRDVVRFVISGIFLGYLIITEHLVPLFLIG